MDSSNSFLSDSKYGYDFVVATTQASINSGLLEYLSESTQPITYLCFLVDPTTGNPTTIISLDDLLTQTGGVNPFSIAAGTPWDDPRIQTLTQHRFVVGVKMQMGLPPGVLPKDLPLIAELGNSANNVTFRMFCSDFQIIQNSPPSWGSTGNWNVWSQPSGTPWYVETRADLVNKDLNKELDTPYFNSHPERKTEILAQLQNLSSTAFSLQQLLFDMDNAVVMTVPNFEGVPAGSNAEAVLQKSFVSLYSTAAKNYGEPLVAVTAVSQTIPDPSQLKMTSFERQVSLLKDSSGVVIPNPTPDQAAVSTLDHLCMVNNNSMPGASTFSWDWVLPQDENNESGIIAINRNVFSHYLMDVIMPSVKQSCVTSNVKVTATDGVGDWKYQFDLTTGQTPQTAIVTDPSSGSPSNVISISYTSSNDASTQSNDSYLLFYIEMKIQPNYTCSVNFYGNTITITQRLWVYIFVKWDATGAGCNGYDVTLTDVYNISVDGNGNLQLVRDASKQNRQDNSQSPDRSWLVNLFTGVNDASNSVKQQINSIIAMDLNAITFSAPQNFVFPGAKVFSYASAAFSQHQDLLCNITYTAPRPPILPPKQEGINVAAQPKTTHSGLRTVRAARIGEAVRSQPSAAGWPAIKANGLQPVVQQTNGIKSVQQTPKPAPEPAPKPGTTQAFTPSRPLGASPAAAGMKMTHSSDFIQNYVQGEIVSPTGKFEALQTDDGHSLLFGMNTARVLHVIKEQSGTSRTGWIPDDLSSATLASSFANDKNAVVRTFDVGQSALDGSIGLAMAISSGGTDNLFLSLYNSSTDTSWTASPVWTAVPFDVQTSAPRSAISIVGILFAETQNNQQYIIVDLDRSTNSTVKDIKRFYVDPLKSSGRFWSSHDVPVDIESGNYQSCVGRVKNGFVDGVYTCGTAGQSGQLVYVPVVNVFGAGPPLPSRLTLPGVAVASAIAVARNMDPSSPLFGTTDLYAISASTMYRFPVDGQNDGAVARPLMTNSFFSGTEQMTAMTHDGVVTIWGKNGSNQVFYVSCPTAQVSVPGAWSSPVPILAGVERMSAYVNRSDGGNTILASGGGKLQRLTQATDTDSKVWRADEIQLEAAAPDEPLSFMSYTTTIQVVNAQDLPSGAANVSLTAPSRTPVYMNGLYYVLSEKPVSVPTDPNGTLTVTEAVEDINGTVLTVSCDGGTTWTAINPMEQSFQKMTALNTERSLRGATFPTNTVAGGTLGAASSAPLVPPATTSTDINVVVDSMSKLSTVYDSVKPPTATTITSFSSPSGTPAFNTLAARAPQAWPQAMSLAARRTRRAPRVVPHTLFIASPSVGSLGDDIAIAAGDLFRWLKSGIKCVVHILKDAVSDAWHFIATIAGKVYRAALDSVNAVMGAVEWIFDAIKTGIQDVMHYLEFLFDWDDVRRTKDVMHNVTKLWLRAQVDGIQTARVAFDGQVAAVEKSINQWAGITDWSAGLGSVAAQPAAESGSNPAAGQTSGSQLLSSHFKNHASELTVVGSQPSVDVVQNVVDDLLAALEQEGQVLSAVYTQLLDLATKFASMSMGDVLKRLAGILANGILSSVQVVVDALLNVLTDVASAAIGILDTKIHIPVISDILNAIGFPDISFLDLFTWIPAVAYTVVYKIANSRAPFPDNGDVKSIISANSWDTLSALLGQQQQPLSPVVATFKQDVLHGIYPPNDSFHRFAVRRPSGNSLKSRASMSSLSSYASTSTMSMSTAPSTPGSILPLSPKTAQSVFVAGHSIAGFTSFMSVFVSTFEAEGPSGDANPFGIPSAALGIIGGASQGIADVALPKDPVRNEAVAIISKATTAMTILAKLVFSGPGQNYFKAKGAASKFAGLAVGDGRATGAVVNSVLILPAAAVTAWHLSELAGDPAGGDRSCAIVGEVANVTGYVSRVSYAVAVNDKDPESRQVPIAVMAAANISTAGLQTAQAIIN